MANYIIEQLDAIDPVQAPVALPFPLQIPYAPTNPTTRRQA